MSVRVLDAETATTRLRARGIEIARGGTAPGPDEVARLAAELDSERLVVKAAGLLHKSDLGGVVLDLRGPVDARAAAVDMLERLGEDARPFLVQEQRRGVELLVGLRCDAKLGAAVLVGRGGTTAELEDDTAYALAPLDHVAAEALLGELRIWPVLTGYRGETGVDLDAVKRMIVAVSELAVSDPDIVELDLNPLLAGPPGTGAVAVDVRIAVTTEPASSRHRRPVQGLRRAMQPRHVAVVGVSDDPHKTGARLFRYLDTHGFAGRLDPIHPSGGTIMGRPRARALTELDAVPDLVCIAVPAQRVPPVVRECADLGVAGIIVHSSGFAETDAVGEALQQEIARIAEAADLALIGPNSMGVVRPHAHMTASISGGLEHPPAPGSTALVTGSGALGSCLATRLMGSGTGLSAWIHVGNEAGLTVADHLEWLAEDPETDSIGILLEDLADGPAFVEAGRRLRAAGRPVLAYDLVRSEGARAAALSHTGALLGSLALRRIVLRAAGVVTTTSLEVLEDALRLLAHEQRPRGRRLAAVTFSGGACSIISHEAKVGAIDLPALPTASRRYIAEQLPAYAAIRNPIDVSYELISQPEAFEHVLQELVDSTAFDALLVQFTTNADPYAEHTAAAAIAVRDSAPIPVYLARYGGAHLAPRALARYHDAGIHLMDAPDRAVRAIAAVMAAVCPPEAEPRALRTADQET